MKTFAQHWNPKGQKTALLIHGISSSSHTWKKLADYLVENNYHVIAPDLTGHGQSFWNKKYSINNWINESLEALEGNQPDIIVGHSLGGLIATGVALQTRPKHTILLDPAWDLPTGLISIISKRILAKLGHTPEEKLRKNNPLWSEEDIQTELQTMSTWDKKTVHGLKASECRKIMVDYFKETNQTLIIKPIKSWLIRGKMLTKVKNHGITLVNMPYVGHNPHREDFKTFIETFHNFINTPIAITTVE